MDSELRALAALLSANQPEQTEFWEKQLPLSLFPLREKEAHWIYRHRERYGKFPSLAAFQAKFDEQLEPVNDPLKVVFEPLLVQSAFTQVKNIVDTARTMFDEKTDPSDILAFFRESAQKLDSHDSEYVDENMNNPRTAMNRYREELRRHKLTGAFIDSPWPRMNKLLNWCRPGEQVILAGRTSLGKTWLGLEWMNYLGSKGVSTLVISKEMPTQQIADRLTALRFGLDWERFRSLSMDVFDQVHWKIAARKAALLPYPIIVSGDETLEGTGLEQVYAKIQKIKPYAVMVDGAYMLNVKGLAKSANDVEKLTAISRGLKRIAKVTKTVTFDVIQMNRSAETKKGVAKGGITTLYGADAWGQDADVVLEVAGERGANERVISIHKSRETNIGDFFVNFQLSPRPNFREKTSLSANSALGSLPFKVLK